MKQKWFMLLALVTVASLLLASCGPAAGGAVIKVATQSPLSGGQSAIGVDIKNGAELALSAAQRPPHHDGLHGPAGPLRRPGQPGYGRRQRQEHRRRPRILCVVGHYNSGVQIPSSEVYHTAGLANVSPANTNPKVTDRGYPEVSRIVGRDDVQGAVGAQFANTKGIKTVYVLHDKTTYGQGIAEFFRKEAEKLGMKVLGFDGTEEKANFDALLTPIICRQAGCGLLRRHVRPDFGLHQTGPPEGLQGMFISDDGFDSPEAVKIGGDALIQGGGTYYSTVAGPAKLYPGTAKFQTDFKAKYNDDPKPFAAQGYDSMGICLKAIEEAAKATGNKLPTRAQVTTAIRALKDYQGITGTINFNAKGDLTAAKYFVIQVVSADPAKWNDNTIDQTLSIAPPQ